MATQCDTHLSAEDRETLSLGLAHGHSLRTMASILGRAPSTVSCEHTWRRLGSVTTAVQTPGFLAVAVRQDASGRGLLIRADCRAAQTRIS